VRAGEDHGRLGAHAREAEPAEDVAGGIDPRREPGRLQLAEQPRARLLVRRTPAHARDAAARQRAEAREREQPVFESRQRHGEHDPGVYRLDFMTVSFLE